MGDTSGTTTVRETERKYESDGPLDAGLVAELATDDRVTGCTLGAETGATSWAEIEVELAGQGTLDVLDQIEATLGRNGVHRSASASKLGRVLADRIPPTAARPAAGEDATVGDVVLAYLWEQADAVRAEDPAIRRDVPDGVHAMRVACLRMRSTLQSLRALLDRERTDAVVAELRWLAGELGGARDLEVQEERIGRAVAPGPDGAHRAGREGRCGAPGRRCAPTSTCTRCARPPSSCATPPRSPNPPWAPMQEGW